MCYSHHCALATQMCVHSFARRALTLSPVDSTGRITNQLQSQIGIHQVQLSKQFVCPSHSSP